MASNRWTDEPPQHNLSKQVVVGNKREWTVATRSMTGSQSLRWKEEARTKRSPCSVTPLMQIPRKCKLLHIDGKQMSVCPGMTKRAKREGLPRGIRQLWRVAVSSGLW